MLKFILVLFMLTEVCFAAPIEATLLNQAPSIGLPSKLLEAIAIVETGQRSGNSMTPYPWSINVAGKGYTYKTKADAIKAVRAFQAKGFDSIDVGIMQINLKHHPNAFQSLEDAFDPKKNISYAARFLKNLYMKHRTWHAAVKHYHSGNPALGNIYLQKVLKAWAQVKGKDFIFGPMHLVRTSQFDNAKIPEPGKFKSTIQTNSKKNITISGSFFPIKMVGSGAAEILQEEPGTHQESQRNVKDKPGAIKNEGCIFPLVVTAVVKPNGKKTKMKATPLVLSATDVMPLR